MTVEIFELIGLSFLLVTLVMTLLWGVYWHYQNVGIVDIGWALCFFFTGIAGLIFGDGHLSKRIVLASMIAIWGLRLAWYLFKRFEPSHEDPRYTEIKKKFGPEILDFQVYLFFMFQGLLVILLSVPLLIVFGYSELPWHLYEGLGILIWGLGLFGESVADHQLETFKQNPDNKGKVCQAGLWGISRHPNYFFEWVIWIGFFCFAYPTVGIFASISPLIILILLTRISGIPLAEKQSIKSKGEAYKEYQKTTSAFFPWPF